MSIDIRSGGAVAVDTEALRAAADRYGRERTELDEVCRLLRVESARLSELAEPTGDGTPWRIELLTGRVDSAAAHAGDLEHRLRELAAAYEIVELRATRACAEAVGDDAAVRRLDAQLAEHLRGSPAAAVLAGELEAAWLLRSTLAFAGPVTSGALPLGVQGASIALLLQVAASGIARVGSDERLRGIAEPVVVKAAGAPGPATAPRTVAAALARIPSGDTSARVRVERYAMPDGSRRFAVYVGGTRSGSVTGGADPWDMHSNLQLYGGETSSSYEATRMALREAGARPGDRAYIFGHSQGGMIADRLALQGGLDTRLLVTAGSPTEADVGSSTLSVQLRHTDDVVPTLAAGGSAGSVGAPGSIVAERVADPLPGPQDLTLEPHHLTTYLETARELDASADPRVTGVHDVLSELRGASSVEVTEFAARRTP